MSSMTIRERWEEFKRSFRENDVPKCPECRGTGEPHRYWTMVYWKGRPHQVCGNCEGSGRV